MDPVDAIQKRWSVPEYTGYPIPNPDLENIVDAGRLVPTGHNHQLWIFIVITELTTIQRLYKAVDWITRTEAIIAVVMDNIREYWVEDGSAAINNTMLGATDIGYGLIFQFRLREDSTFSKYIK